MHFIRLYTFIAFIVLSTSSAALDELNHKIEISQSALGWNLKTSSGEVDSSQGNTIIINPNGKRFDVGKTSFPDIVPTSLLVIKVPELSSRFLIIHTPPAASGSVEMPIYYLDKNDVPILAANIKQRYEFSLSEDNAHSILNSLFQDLDNDGIPELVEKDFWKDQGTITYYSFSSNKTFVPILIEYWEYNDGFEIISTKQLNKPK